MVDPRDLKRALRAVGLEVFRTRGEEVHLAERQNVQLMEAGVRVRGGLTPHVYVVARAQRSDSQASTPELLFELVRSRSEGLLAEGFVEVGAEVREIRSVSDPEQLIDTWFEVTYARPADDIDGLVRLAVIAIRSERYVTP